MVKVRAYFCQLIWLMKCFDNVKCRSSERKPSGFVLGRCCFHSHDGRLNIIFKLINNVLDFNQSLVFCIRKEKSSNENAQRWKKLHLSQRPYLPKKKFAIKILYSEPKAQDTLLFML